MPSLASYHLISNTLVKELLNIDKQNYKQDFAD